jgi:hypothetical protein
MASSRSRSRSSRLATSKTVIARLDRAPGIPELSRLNFDAAAYWITRSSRVTTTEIGAGDPASIDVRRKKFFSKNTSRETNLLNQFNESTRRANHFWLSENVSSPFRKNNSVLQK